nr:citrate lyase subunit alpha [uncultured Oscillibacter sp.]
MSKVAASLAEAIRLCGLEDGMTVSFHHCLRGGDTASGQIAEAIHSLGIQNLTVAPSSLSGGNDVLIPYIEDGTFTKFRTSGFSPALGRLLQAGKIREVCELRTHGGRPAALKTGEIRIDIAFVAAAIADRNGNCNGTGGRSAFGSMGYSLTDVRYAKKVIVITDHLSPFPVFPISIDQSLVDYVVQVESIGDPAGIATGAMRLSSSPLNARIAELAAKAIIHSGHLREGVAMQTGSGKISLSVAARLEEEMKRQGITGSYAMGGITAALVRMHEEGLIRTLYDTQSFDQTAIASLARNPGHIEVSAEAYASPLAKGGPIVNGLDFVILGATEIDTDFNVNVITDSNGWVISGAGGHGDTAEGAKLTVITAPLYRNKYPTILDRVTTIATPGRFVDLFVCQEGVAVNTIVPGNQELALRLADAGIPIRDIHDLQRAAERFTGKLPPLKRGSKTVGRVYWRDGSVIDEIKNTIE